MKNQTCLPADLARREFHVSRRARERYEMPDTLFSGTGNVVFADFHAARTFAHHMNQRRDLLRRPERAVTASQIHALGLIDEVLHLLVARYRRERAPGLLADALARIESRFGREKTDLLLIAFVDEFPPTAVFRGDLTAGEYLDGRSGGETHREVALEELLLLWLANRNPAFAPFIELFDESGLCRATDYRRAMEQLETFLDEAPDEGEEAGESLLSMLYAPMRAAPNSLQGQLEFIRKTWAELLGPDLYRVLGGLDFLAEENRVFFPAGSGPVEAPDYSGVGEAEENFSPDREWMPRVVLLAKNAHVWLAQLSRKHGREITTLDAIPDSELEVLGEWGISGLWLIGVWERSRASERIKKMMGDDEAVASAYSLEDYCIADDLGGEAAFEDLRERAWRYGIRLSTDMVPNHMGIDSRWVIEHPDWFIGRDESPFPSYTFDGPDLSDDDRVSIFIEDHYWQRSDAAVVFKRVDRATGAERYIYHGNDGTSMPWNDTAQLDYRRPEVREAVIQTILSVARRSPVIRFDAAMTLAREHYQRLWFPEPGSGGDIPSRAEYGMTRAEFEKVMPEEFWREVVDRVAAEAPDTLLLAEAFWLLEGYFVRTLGMHRVYNSAFMNMLRDERNAEYRQLIRNTLEFDPQILKRYVNFMSNPDERTAIDQFGADDKYFGVATLMATLPG
ncbi:MAG: alpha-amylase family glycosyl hydrolase, partial [Thermoanaerobaculales bacterium]